MRDALQVLVDFAEGRITGREFEAELYENSSFEDVLDDDPDLEPRTYIGASVYLFVLQQNFGSPDGVLNAHGAVVQFLERNGHDIDPTNEYRNQYQMLLRVHPPYASAPTKYLVEHVLPPLSHLKYGDLEEALRADLKRRFRFNRKPPRWIQGAEWPINENGPLVFLGQLPVYAEPSNSATLFVFRDAKTGVIQTVEQCD